MTRVLIRFRADHTVGRGHLARCLPLTRALVDHGAHVTLAVDESTPYFSELDLPGVRLELDPAWDRQTLRNAARTQDVVVLDRHDVLPDEVTELRDIAPVVGLSAVGPAIAHVDLLVNPVAAEALDALGTPSNARPDLLTGRDGVIVDHARFDHVRGMPRLERVLLVALGGGRGHVAELAPLVSALATYPSVERAVVCTIERIERPAAHVEIVAEPADFPQLLATATLVICGMGTTLYEAASLGTPTVVLPHTACHRQQARWLEPHGFLRVAEPDAADVLLATCGELVHAPDARARMSRAGRRFVRRGTTESIAHQVVQLATRHRA